MQEDIVSRIVLSNNSVKNCHMMSILIFGTTTSLLWIIDFFKMIGSVYGMIGIFLLLLGNITECWICYTAFIHQRINKFQKIASFALIILIGVAFYSASSSEFDGISSFSIAIIIVQVLFVLYGIILLIKRNKKLRDGTTNDSVHDEFLENALAPEIPNIVESEAAEHSDTDEELKKFIMENFENNSPFLNFEKKIEYYPKVVKHENEIVGVVSGPENQDNPYSSRDIELNAMSTCIV